MTVRRSVVTAVAICIATSGTASADMSETTAAIDQSRRTAIVQAVEAVAPAVVTVAARQVRYIHEVVPMFEFDTWFPFEMPGMTRLREQLVSSLSSGVVFAEGGLMITNEHGVPDGSELTVTLPDGREAKSDQIEVVGKDPVSDVAVLRIDLPDVLNAPLGSSDDLMIGEWVVAIGNPFGYVIGDPHPSVSVGVVSALNRCFRGRRGDRRIYRNMIQTDASINQGNSGGPLVNAAGQVVGINTFIISRSGGSIGLGFAIPVERARRVADELLRYGRVRPVDLGFSVGSVGEGMARRLGLTRTSGVVVVELAKKGGAARAGLKLGDLIYEINGRSINDIENARMVFLSLLVGDHVDMKVERGGEDVALGFDIIELK